MKKDALYISHTLINSLCCVYQIVFTILLIAVVHPLQTAFRVCNLLSIAIHGLGHALMLYSVTGDKQCLCSISIMEGLSYKDMVLSLNPRSQLPQLSSKPPIINTPHLSPISVRLVASGGIAMNGLSLGFLWFMHEPISAVITTQAFGIALPTIVLLISFVITSFCSMLSVPDIQALLQGMTTRLACGPAFAIRYKPEKKQKNDKKIVSSRCQNLVTTLAREAATRGGQSGGFAIMTSKYDNPSVIFDKAVKGKREDIVQVMSHKMQSLLSKAQQEGFSRPEYYEAVLLHLRYATGGATHWHNAQPHWYEHYNSMMQHTVKQQNIHSEVHEVFNMIAHNGDMDGLYLTFNNNGVPFRQLFTQPEARQVFQTLMPWTTSHGNSDSRSIAEWVDFVYTQGLTFKALRYAYCTAVLDFNQHINGHEIDYQSVHEWADRLDLFLMNAANEKHNLEPNAESINDLSDLCKEELSTLLFQLSAVELGAKTSKRFCRAFAEAFFLHDLTWVMRQASLDFVGEFALMVCSTLEARMGIFSLTQAFSIGHNITRGEIFGSAEPQGVTSALHQGQEDDKALQIYLQDGQYATIEYLEQQAKESIKIYHRAQLQDDFSQPPRPAENTLTENLHSPASEWFPVNNNPKIERYKLQEHPAQEIEKDLQDIPFILKRVQESFLTQHENWATMENFSSLLLQNIFDQDKDPNKYDLVLFGVDFNQDLINEFALGLRPLLPTMKIRAENSGNVLKEMKRTKREGIGPYGDKTVFLGVSNSAQTQSTLAAIRKACELVGKEQCFVLTQSFLNSMSQALGQSYQVDAPVIANTFVNLTHRFPDNSCGRRRSEAATIVPVATQAVLTEILIGIAQRALKIYQHLSPDNPSLHGPECFIRHDLHPKDITAFREFQAAVYEIEIPNRVGFNSAGEPIDSPDTHTIAQEAKARAENNIEFVRSYALFAAYIFIATVFGIPVFGLLVAPISSWPGIGIIASLLDAILFLCALWFIHMGFRYHQKRPLLERMGARAELFIDRKYIARMVERYNATLFSNAPAFLTPFFYWADTVQDSLHRFGIRAHRGVVTIHRTPDERMGIEEANNAAEENMVFAQIGGIRFNFGQPQSRDKVREGSWYMNRSAEDFVSRPYQSVLSDSLAELRTKYDQQLSPEALRLINRRLIDLSDGLIFEFVVGYQRKELVNQSMWSVIGWMPGARVVRKILLQYGIDIKNIIGHADTANQAQIQSTKHPVSPMDIHLDTMEPRLTYDAFSKQQVNELDNTAVLAFYDDHISISFSQHSLQSFENIRYSEISLYREADGTLSSRLNDAQAGEFSGCIKRVAGQEHLIIENNKHQVQLSFPITELTAEQRWFLNQQLQMVNILDIPTAA